MCFVRMLRSASRMRLHCISWQNRLYALTIFAVFSFLGLMAMLQSTGGVQSVHRPAKNHQNILVTTAIKNHTPTIAPEWKKLLSSRKIINPHDFRYIVANENYCKRRSKPPSLLIFVSSSPKNFQQRFAIRETWGNATQLDAAVLFLLGNAWNLDIQKYVMKESHLYGDIIQEDFIDSYKNLTLKSVAALKWTKLYCPSVKAIMKTDDDIYVNVPYLTQYLEQSGKMADKHRWIVGCIKDHALQPVHIVDGKLKYDSPVVAPPGHPPFLAGAGYVISGDIVNELYSASLRVKMIPVEDVFVTAHCARAISVKPEHDSRFTCGDRVDVDCSMAFMFTGHKISPTRQYHIWTKLHNGNECQDLNRR